MLLSAPESISLSFLPCYFIFAIMVPRVRFAPSPTGGLHLGGVRTALFNYLFTKKQGGQFILRVEDTDQTRYVEGAEDYIYDCLDWCRIPPDESPKKGGPYAPYRQSERKPQYKAFAEKLIQSGHAYYAFDTPEEIEALRQKLREEGRDNLQYGHQSRMRMKNSLTLTPEKTKHLIEQGVPHVVRLKVEPAQTVRFTDLVKGEMEMTTDSVDDKVLLKADEMPTYHLAVVVDDHAMKITHTFRGEEWLPSTPVHILLYKYFGWENEMPQFAHFPLILKPDGNGKLSKRDGERLGFPVFAMEWNDPKLGKVLGFRELGFLPEAFVNMLALLGWNDGSGKEVFSLDELVNAFDINRVHSHGAKFDYEKAKWFNHEWIKKLTAAELMPSVLPLYEKEKYNVDDRKKVEEIISLVKERCTLLPDFIEQSGFFFTRPKVQIDLISEKWTNEKEEFFNSIIEKWEQMNSWEHDLLESSFKDFAREQKFKTGEVLFPLRVLLVGGKFGPGVFDIARILGKEETLGRIHSGIRVLNDALGE